ncbi:GIY-YIG nuclease family protein [Streptomyces sp. NPDC059456]|uniref:GIY-YIG nuclease family protein n=1 Tax=Streptomyces sp. NPDC059456 TaxID=3346838 RepID=UPI00368F64DA
MPQRTALYRLYNATGALLYVGITCDPERRFGDHTTKGWWSTVDHGTLKWFNSESLALEAELEAILTEAPKHNIQGTKPYRERQREVALAISPEKRRARSVGQQARAIQVRTLRELKAAGVPDEEAKRQALLAREEHKKASGLFG